MPHIKAGVRWFHLHVCGTSTVEFGTNTETQKPQRCSVFEKGGMRWSLCATDRCFKNGLMSAFFRAGQVWYLSGLQLYTTAAQMVTSAAERQSHADHAGAPMQTMPVHQTYSATMHQSEHCLLKLDANCLSGRRCRWSGAGAWTSRACGRRSSGWRQATGCTSSPRAPAPPTAARLASCGAAQLLIFRALPGCCNACSNTMCFSGTAAQLGPSCAASCRARPTR